MLVIIVINITIYTIASFWLTYVSGLSVDSTLTTGFFTFWGTEIALLAGIKVSKVIKKPLDDDEYTSDFKDEESEEDNMG